MEETQGATMFHGRFVFARAPRHYLLLRRGVVPHETNNDAFTRSLRLRCAPPSTRPITPKRARAADAASFAPERASCEAGCERSCLSRSPLRRLPLASSTPKRARAADAASSTPKRARAADAASFAPERASCEAGCERLLEVPSPEPPRTEGEQHDFKREARSDHPPDGPL